MKYFAIITAVSAMMLSGCSKKDDDYQLGKGLQLKDVIAFANTSQAEVAADNTSTYLVGVQISREADSLLRDVVFTVKGGTFDNDDTIQTVTANSSGYAQVRLKSDSIGSAVVRASVQKYYTIDTAYTFGRSYPNDFLLSASQYVGDTASSFTFTVDLFRAPGKGIVTDPAKVYFNMVSLDTTLQLVIPAFAYTENQQAMVTATNPFHLAGDFELQVKTLRTDTDTLLRTLRIQVR
ncbi:hypothetical protein WJU16_22880 [Chitinophaga pollutisoli]|uniref:DUF4397 domain-containing protein n=1 Tax=Chitinophaga pollutisoli TaxID=3133966 RepID=A0ABZ2YMV7_9BACT